MTPITLPPDLAERVQGYADRLGRPRDTIICDAILGLLTNPCKAHHGLGLIAEAGDPEIHPDGTLTTTPVAAVFCSVDAGWKREVVELLTETIEAIQADPR